jgi:hypothetical protein
MNLTQLKEMFAGTKCTKLYAKPLAPNDNSKNQVYFGPGFDALNLFPNKGVRPEPNARTPMFKASVDFGWLFLTGHVSPAPGAQLILYPQYPEVRFSGFLKGCAHAPSDLMASRLEGRILFLGVTNDRQIVGYVAAPDSPIANEFRALALEATDGVFTELALPATLSPLNARNELVREIGRIHRLGWINSKQLGRNGELLPCEASLCGGFTLEAELGIAKNSDALPDFHGWEIKQYAVTNFTRADSGKPITLMTPEPDGGYYRDQGVEAFIRRFGYADRMGRADRMNFGGRHEVGQLCGLTNLTMRLSGFDAATRMITDVEGAIELVNPRGDVAASWSFGKMLEHWSRKHRQAAYIPSMCRKEPRRQYCYGGNVRLAEQTDSLKLLGAFANGSIYYDPGIKMEGASSAPRIKRRSQFRIASRDINDLYKEVNVISFND